MKKFMGFILPVVLPAFLLCTAAQAQIGIFEQAVDVGEPALAPGQSSFNNGTYEMDAIGTTIGRSGSLSDQFHFIYREMSGSFSFEADPFVIEDAGRAGIMIRQSLDPDAAHVSFLMTSQSAADSGGADSSVYPTFRFNKGSGTNVDGNVELGDDHIGPVRIERIGNSFHFYTLNSAGEWLYHQTEVVAMEDPVLIGLAGTGEGDGNLGLFEINDVNVIEYPLSVVRDIPVDDVQNTSITGITINANVRSGETVDATVNELAPIGSTISNVQATAGEVTFSAKGSINWVLNGHSGDATLTYDVELAENRAPVWQGTFNDNLSLDSFIGNEATLPKTPAFTVPANPISITSGVNLIEAEWASVLDDPTGFLVYSDPRLFSGHAVMGIANRGSLEFELDVQEPGEYFLIASTRGEDGNSDSFYIGFDFLERTDDFGFPLANNKQYTQRWWEHFDPNGRFWNRIANDHKTFNLAAGQVFLVVQERESSAKLDWIAITNDPNTQIGLIGTPKQGENFSTDTSPIQLVNGEAFIEAEDAVLEKDPPEGSGQLGLGYDRNASGEVYVENTVTNGSSVSLENRIDFHFNVTEPGLYRIIANTRTPNGGDDSFWVGLDGEPPIADNNADRFTGSGILDNNFHTSWVTTDFDSELAWDLDAGAHVFSVYSREDGSQIDWILITNDLDQDPTTRTAPDDGGQDPPVSVENFSLY